jgi:hypothetical protein
VVNLILYLLEAFLKSLYHNWAGGTENNRVIPLRYQNYIHRILEHFHPAYQDVAESRR